MASPGRGLKIIGVISILNSLIFFIWGSLIINYMSSLFVIIFMIGSFFLIIGLIVFLAGFNDGIKESKNQYPQSEFINENRNKNINSRPKLFADYYKNSHKKTIKAKKKSKFFSDSHIDSQEDTISSQLDRYNDEMKIVELPKAEYLQTDAFELYEIGLELLSENELQKAKYYLYKGLKKYSEINDIKMTSKCLMKLGLVSIMMKYYKDAMKFFKESLKIFQTSDELDKKLECLFRIGCIYKIKENYHQSLIYLKNALRLSQKIEDLEIEKQCLGFINEINKKTNKPKEKRKKTLRMIRMDTPPMKISGLYSYPKCPNCGARKRKGEDACPVCGYKIKNN